MRTSSLDVAILRLAAMIVPGPQRTEWFDEWRSELWYALQGSKRGEATKFCLGAFKDAVWLRRNNANPDEQRILWLRSPLQCFLFLAVAAGVSLFFASRLPWP